MQTIEQAVLHLQPISLEEMDRVKLMNRMDTKFAFRKEQLISLLPQLAAYYSILEINGNRTPSYTSLYFDTNNLRFFYDHHRGKTDRFKVRFRKYIDSDLSFLEIKHKYKGRTDKKRIRVADIPESLTNEQKIFLSEAIHDNLELEPHLWNAFHRLTLVNKYANERLTLDFDLVFKWQDKDVQFENLIIAELKQNKLDRNSAFFSVMKKMGIRPYRLSKYCIGAIELYGDSDLKYNRFKKKLLTLKKINNYAS